MVKMIIWLVISFFQWLQSDPLLCSRWVASVFMLDAVKTANFTILWSGVFRRLVGFLCETVKQNFSVSEIQRIV